MKKYFKKAGLSFFTGLLLIALITACSKPVDSVEGRPTKEEFKQEVITEMKESAGPDANWEDYITQEELDNLYEFTYDEEKIKREEELYKLLEKKAIQDGAEITVD